MSYENPWHLDNKPFEDPADYVGFVYLITHIPSNKKYIGKKLFMFSKTKMVKKKKKRFKAESDWKTYYGSSEELLTEIGQSSTLHYRRDIIRLCKSKSEMTYIESKHIFETNALLRDDYYNGWISCRVRKNQLKGISI